MEKHFLETYKTHEKPEAVKAAERKEQRTGEKGIVRDRSERIQAYVERLEKIFLNPDLRVRERNIKTLKPTIYKNTLIKEEDFPESHFEFQKQQLKDRGFDENTVNQAFDGEKKEKEINRVIESQKLSLDSWIDYLTGEDCRYPADIRFFAIQGVLRLGNFDTEKYSFTKRIPSTTAPFVEIDREALSIVLGAMEAKQYNKPTEGYSEELLTLIDRGNSFGDMYAKAMQELDQKAEKSDLLHITEGKWIKFEKGSDPQELVNALTGKRSNLCIADIGSATSYLNQGDIEVYFSHNRAKQPTIPRIAVAYDEERGVYEVRGTYNKSEDIDPEITETSILKDRLKDLPNGESFAKKDMDMKQMTEIYKKCFKIDRKTKEKTYLNPELTKEELVFLYEIDQKIEGFGYNKDPRIEEIREKRNIKEDVPVVLGCKPEEIATKKSEVNENTKAYIGKLFPNIFKTKIDQIFTSFPEGKIQRYQTQIGGKNKKELKSELEEKKIFVSDYAKYLLNSKDFKTSETQENLNLVRLTVKDLGFPNGATIEEIYKRAEDFGLELCPAEVGPHLRLSYSGADWMFIAMKQITDRDGSPDVFSLSEDGDELKLGTSDASPGRRWRGSSRFVFLLRKV
ncbi:MAG: hypothetical protein V1896_02670 [Candidatus Zambryskibacteria bacterium]